MPIDRRIAVTNHSIPILNKIISSPIFTSPMDKQLLKMESDTRIFISAHPNIIFTHADKGNVTIAMDKDAYMYKMEQWNFISTDCSLPRDEFLGAIQFILDSTFFSFDNKIYKQSFGTPMGSPLPVIVDLVMRRLKTVSLMSLNLDIVFYYRYVDDICTAVSSSKIDNLLKQFNSFHPRLQFTTEIGGDKIKGGNAINFLDITVSVNENRCYLDWYRKPTFLGRFLNFHSNHPLTQKKGTIFSLVDRAFLLSDNIFHTKNLTFIINILLLNDYPLDFIFDFINQRIKNLIEKKHNVHNVVIDSDVTKESTSWLTVPFIPSHTEKFRTLRKNKGDIRVAFHSPNKMSKNSAKCAILYISAENDGRVLPMSFQIQEETINFLAQGESYTHLGVPTEFPVDQTPYVAVRDIVARVLKDLFIAVELNIRRHVKSAWASLRGMIGRRIGYVPSCEDIASFLSGSLNGRMLGELGYHSLVTRHLYGACVRHAPVFNSFPSL
ncbi:hypothetical protein ALC56_07093 [Trachymyrmex septentrionalis]|uniref:Helix-turn-helix domain-containing protein n=1 Tax=Trachymyrmex septentrionalis TaxID=34720 RepID=A0A151JW62_9HYME|nr:hypothetical protein ALC56_07093 [Trachymyrmex septentrionalis]